MVNSGSFDSDGQGDRNAKANLTQPHNGPDSAQSSSPVTASVAVSCNAGFSQTADSGLPSVAHAIEPTPTKTEFNCDMPVGNFTNLASIDGEAEESATAKSQAAVNEKNSLCCSLPLEKIQGVLTSYHAPLPKPEDDGGKAAKQPTRKLLCLYCDRSFVSANLRQKHVERIHSVKQNRRVSSRRQNQLTVTPCVYCDKLNGTENTLKDLFQHLINEHSSKYFGCLPCEDRFLTSSLLADHNAIIHKSTTSQNIIISDVSASPQKPAVKSPVLDGVEAESEETEEIPVKITRSKMKPKPEENSKSKKSVIGSKKKTTKLKELRSKKYSVKSSRIALKRRESKRLQAIAKITDTQKKKRPRPVEKKNSNTGKTEQTNSTKSTEKIKTNPTCINPYPEFDHFYRVKKITDHSIDNLKISSLTFDDVFDKAFFNRIRCNIEENLLHHIDGKLFKNEESESRISNFEKVSNIPQEIQNSNSENYGCELSLNAVTPVASLSLNSQFGEDFESQIEYGSKPSKKKTQPRKDEVHYKYFTRRKYQASILEHKENRDLSKLDMWTQLVIKKRQQKMLDDKKSAKEILEYTSCDEYKNKLKREELNRILDRRGPFEDLKEEASKKAAFDKLNSASEDNVSEETFTEVREVLNEILNRVYAATDEVSVHAVVEAERTTLNGRKEDIREIPGYLNLRRSSSLPSDGEIDKSDKIALICSSQETENFELPTNQVRGKNELIELTGEWARCRMYICAACGAKLPNMRYLLDHKSLYHQNVWVQHYEFVGNQSELYRHLSIPALGKVGAVEDSVQCKLWKRSEARLCTKCGKQCNSLGELHRHILECGGDWTWMLARKKCKYRPFGAKSRRKRRGLIHRIHNKQKTEPTEKKTYKKTFEGPRQRPSDADTIQRMLANLPAKRSTRKLISLQDGIYRARKSTQNIKQNKVKCGKVIYKSSSRKETTEKTINTTPSISKTQINSSANRRSLRNFNKVLASRILDTNTNLSVKRKIKALNERRKTRQSLLEQEISKEIVNDENLKQVSSDNSVSSLKPKSKVSKKEDFELEDTESSIKRSSPRSSPKNLKKMSVKKLLTGKINIKSFFPVKKKKSRKILSENQNPQATENTDVENSDIKTRSKRKCIEPCEAEEEEKKEIPIKTEIKTIQKKTKHETFSTLVRSLSLRKNKLSKKTIAAKTTELKTNNVNLKKENHMAEKSQENKPENLHNNHALDKSKKRKLKNSFRNAINKVKKLKIDTVPDNCGKSEELKSNSKNQEQSAFLEESNQGGLSPHVQMEKIVIPSISEVKENTADISTTASIAINFHDNNEDPPIPETIFKLELNNEKSLQAKGELDFDTQPMTTDISKTCDVTEENTDIETLYEDTAINTIDKTEPISIETSIKPKIVPLISPNMKGKIRKPTRGLNDCIAMLTSKLQQKTVEENSVKMNSLFDSPFSNKTSVPFRETYPKTECILRIPTYRSQLTHPEIVETALDLSTKSLRNQESVENLETFGRPLNLFDSNSVVKFNNAQFTDFIVPTFERKFNKAFNSVDRIIEEVVENKIQSIVPEIQRRKWNSVDDIIQKVIDEQHITSKIKMPIRNSVDDIIDFVVECGRNTNAINCKVNDIEAIRCESPCRNVVQNKDVTVRKIGSARKPKTKKSTVETETPKIVSVITKDSLDNISPLSKANVIEVPNPLITKNEFLKTKGKSKKVVDNVPELEPKIVIDEECTIPSNEGDTDPKITEINSEFEKGIDISSKEISIQNSESSQVLVNSPEKVILDLNDAFIDTSSSVPLLEKSNTVKNKKAVRKIGQNRNRSRKKLLEVKNTEPEIKFIETNIDVLLNVKEIKSNEMLEDKLNFSLNGENLMTKNAEINQLSNEDEPHLLENKLMTLQCKSKVVPSDSEDDIPLATLVKCDENRTDPSERESKSTYEQKSVSGIGHIIETQNDADTTIIEAKENNLSGIIDEKQRKDVENMENNKTNIPTASHNIDNTCNDDQCQNDITKLKLNEDSINTPVLKPATIPDVKILESEELVNRHTKIIDNNTQSNVNSFKEDSELSKDENELSINGEDNVSPEFVPSPVKRSIKKKSKSMTRKSKKCLKDLVPDDLILKSKVETILNLEITPKAISKPPKNKKINNIDENHLRLICFVENINHNTKPITEEFQSETNSTSNDLEENQSSKSGLDPNTKSIQNKVIHNNVNSEASKELRSLFLESGLDEVSTKSKVKGSKSKGKSEENSALHTNVETKSILVEMHEGELLNRAAAEDSQEEPTDLILGSTQSHDYSNTETLLSKGKKRGTKTEVYDKSTTSANPISSSTCSETSVVQPNEINLLFAESETKVSNKKLNQCNSDRNIELEDISLKNVQGDVCDGIPTSNDYEETDKEIESILCSSQLKTDTKIRSRPSRSKSKKFVVKSDNFDMSSNKKYPQKPMGKSKNKEPKEDTFDNVISTILQEVDELVKENSDKTINEANDVCTKISPEATSTTDTVTSLSEAPLTKTLKEPKQPQMKNLEIALQLTDVTKFEFLPFNNKNDAVESDILIESRKDYVKPEITSKKKRQMKFDNKLSKNINCVKYDNNYTGKIESGKDSMVKMITQNGSLLSQTKLKTVSQTRKPSRSKSRSVKSKIVSNTTKSDDHLETAENLATKKLIEELIESKKEILRSKSKVNVGKEVKQKNEDVNGTSDKFEIYFENIEPKVHLYDVCNGSGSNNVQNTLKKSISVNVKSKVKHRKRATKTSKKAKKKVDKCPQIDNPKTDAKESERNETTVIEKSAAATAINVLVEQSSITLIDNATIKTIDSLDQTLPCIEITNENKAIVEPPIKIIINKQKTRRKSKSFKKIDLKGQNDLFEDFALVIKKPKRLTSIMTFTPTDTFSKDIYPNYLKKPFEEPTLISKVNSEDTEIPAELDSSVEEMDMELDEIPITSNIIEGEAKNFLPPVECTKTDEETFADTLNSLDSESKNITETNDTDNENTNFPGEELFLSCEKDLIFSTEKAVEEILCEKSIGDKNITYTEDTDSSTKNSKTDLEKANLNLDGFYKIVEDLASAVSINETDEKINNGFIEDIIPNVENADKSVENIIDGLLDSCVAYSKESEGKINKSVNKKPKKSKNGKNRNNKIKTGTVTECKDIDIELEQLQIVNNKKNKYRRKRSKSVAEISSDKKSEDVSNDVNKELKFKDIDSIYAFSESEDIEIEKPIEKPKRPPRKQTKSLSESVDIVNKSLIELDLLPTSNCETNNSIQSQDSIKPNEGSGDCNEIISKLDTPKRKSRSSNLCCSEDKFTSEIKENDTIDIQEKKKSVRSAKVKALEHIHDDALAELTESERNRDLDKNKSTISKENSTEDELNKKRVSKRQSRSQKKLIDQLKLLDDSALIVDNANNDQLPGNYFQEKNNLNENIEDLVTENTNKITENELLCVGKQSNQNEIVLPQENKESILTQEAKKRNCKKTNKTQKNKKSNKTFQLSVEDSEKSLLLTNISGDFAGFEELENSIEKELNAEIDLSDTELKNNEKLVESCDELRQQPPGEEDNHNDLLMEDTNQELRRSRRGSRKIASYNENDLIDPLLDEIDSKKKIRKKEKSILESFENKSQKKVKESDKKLNSEELFDLLKASSSESNGAQKLQNVFLNNTEESSKNVNNKDFQICFETILNPPSPHLNLANDTDEGKEEKNISIYEFIDSPESSNQVKNNILSQDIMTKQNKGRSKSTQSRKSQEEESSNSVSINAPLEPSTSDTLELSLESKSKSLKNDNINPKNYCEICNKKFIRTDNLAKHKRTLTHIQKLSEIEAKEAAQKLQSEPVDDVSKTSNSVVEISDSAKTAQSDINIHDILQESDKPNRHESATEHTAFTNNHSLKLADIINDVLNKPVTESDNEKHNSFSDIVMQNNGDLHPEYRRYKSLGERKSFESELIETRPISIPEPYVLKTTILEKQISLLENIIENQACVNYIDDISMSSTNSLENNAMVSPSELSLKQDDSNTYSRINLTKPNANDESFLKPSQYEEISEDSVNLRSYEDQKLRKTLNRDEELFLECCSLLKSGSEMSSYSNKKSHNKILNTMGLKQCDEPEWLERKSLVEKPLYDDANEYSDNSRIPTPLGDSYDDDASYSNTITSNWNMNKQVNVFEDISQDKEEDVNRSFSFQEILNEEESEEKNKSNISKFEGILSNTISALPGVLNKTIPDNNIEELLEKKQEELSDGSTCENKKMITKGARKVFEGLKVSIPTEELNLEVLNCSLKSKKIDIPNTQSTTEVVKSASLPSAKPPRTARKSKPVKNKSQFGSNLLFKMKKKKVMSPTNTNKKNEESKTHDIYDFEETQDNTDVFTKPDFRTFRNMKSNETVAEPESDTDSRDYVDSFSYEAPSITSSISSSSSKKPKTQENITKKKCMIMGRIFKNAAKSKIEDIDEEIRDIPALDNCELVESYVADCKKIIRNEEVSKPNLTEKEINQLFDQLLEGRLGSQDPKDTETKICTKPKIDVKKSDNKKKVKQKNKKRTRTNSDSTDDEFNLNKINKKRAYRKNAKAEDNCINLEQELKECIGVASRKSQRKCTSGKQNVLVEYWSSDDSQFEALLESQRIEVKQPSKVTEVPKHITSEPVLEVITENVSVEATQPVELDTAEKLKPKGAEKKPQQKRKSSGEKKFKSPVSGIDKTSDIATSNRRKRAAVNPLYHWSSSSEDESHDLIEVKPIREELEDDEDRPVQHGWIVGDSPKKLVTMLAQAKGKKTDIDCVKEQGKKRTNAVS